MLYNEDATSGGGNDLRGKIRVMKSIDDIYAKRLLGEGYPEIDQLSHDTFSKTLEMRLDDDARIQRLMTYLGRVVDISAPRRILVLGCGPRPSPALCLSKHGHTVVGIEPIPSFVRDARDYLGNAGTVLEGAAENVPLPAESQDIVFFESVLEHVESIRKSLDEIFRVLARGGILYLTTTNRHRFSFSGQYGEFRVPFYNWFPELVKEGYVFEQLHMRPEIGNFTRRPAVHWLTYSELCNRGREAGFAQFYSVVDLVRRGDSSISRSIVRRTVLPVIQRNPWLRALALTQVGHFIVMLKRRG